MSPPIQITPKAAEKIKEAYADEVVEAAAEKRDAKPNVLRLQVKGGGCAGFQYDLYFDEPKDTDHRYVIEGVDIVIDPISEQFLSGTTLDYLSLGVRSGFKFDNPNISASCGCGDSVAF